jgi:hypothetical protein
MGSSVSVPAYDVTELNENLDEDETGSSVSELKKYENLDEDEQPDSENIKKKAAAAEVAKKKAAAAVAKKKVEEEKAEILERKKAEEADKLKAEEADKLNASNSSVYSPPISDERKTELNRKSTDAANAIKNYKYTLTNDDRITIVTPNLNVVGDGYLKGNLYDYNSQDDLIIKNKSGHKFNLVYANKTDHRVCCRVSLMFHYRTFRTNDKFYGCSISKISTMPRKTSKNVEMLYSHMDGIDRSSDPVYSSGTDKWDHKVYVDVYITQFGFSDGNFILSVPVFNSAGAYDKATFEDNANWKKDMQNGAREDILDELHEYLSLEEELLRYNRVIPPFSGDEGFGLSEDKEMGILTLKNLNNVKYLNTDSDPYKDNPTPKDAYIVTKFIFLKKSEFDKHKYNLQNGHHSILLESDVEQLNNNFVRNINMDRYFYMYDSTLKKLFGHRRTSTNTVFMNHRYEDNAYPVLTNVYKDQLGSKKVKKMSLPVYIEVNVGTKSYNVFSDGSTLINCTIDEMGMIVPNTGKEKSMSYDVLLPIAVSEDVKTVFSFEAVSSIKGGLRSFDKIVRNGSCEMGPTGELVDESNTHCYKAWASHCEYNPYDTNCRKENVFKNISSAVSTNKYTKFFNRSRFNKMMNDMCVKGTKFDADKCDHVCPADRSIDTKFGEWCDEKYTSTCLIDYNMFSDNSCRDYIYGHQETISKAELIDYLKTFVTDYIVTFKKEDGSYDVDKIKEILEMQIHAFFKDIVKSNDTVLAKISKDSDLIARQYFGCLMPSDFYSQVVKIEGLPLDKPHCFLGICNKDDTIRDIGMKQDACPDCFQNVSVNIGTAEDSTVTANQAAECFKTTNIVTGDGAEGGTSGTEGVSGTSGTEGVSGTEGGTSGTEGVSGTEGAEGAEGGTSGTEGVSGTSGTEGVSGTSGTEGVEGGSGDGTEESSEEKEKRLKLFEKFEEKFDGKFLGVCPLPEKYMEEYDDLDFDECYDKCFYDQCKYMSYNVDEVCRIYSEIPDDDLDECVEEDPGTGDFYGELKSDRYYILIAIIIAVFMALFMM